jgi:hypothetical protein
MLSAMRWTLLPGLVWVVSLAAAAAAAAAPPGAGAEGEYCTRARCTGEQRSASATLAAFGAAALAAGVVARRAPSEPR